MEFFRSERVKQKGRGLAARARRGIAWLRSLDKRDLRDVRSRLRRFLLKVVQTLLLVSRIDVVQQLQLHAQALTYDTLLALVPMFAVMFAAVSGFGGLQDLRHRLQDLILSNISGSDEVRAAVAAYLTRFLSNIRSGAFSAISVVLLIYSVLSLLGHIEYALNAVFGSKTRRPWLSRLVTYWAALTLGPLLLGASFALTAALQSSWVAGVVDNLGLGAVLVRLVPLTVTWIAFTAMYLVIPTAHVRLSAAVFAAIFAGSAWSLAKLLYAVYASRAISVQNIYGSLAAVPLFILWLYVSWLLVLLGAQLAFAFQHASTYARETLALSANPAYRERVACRAFLEIARDFFAGHPPTDPDALASHLDIPRRLLETLLGDLKAGGLVREVEGQSGLTPAKDPAHVTVADVVKLLRSGLGVHLPMHDDEARRSLDTIFAELEQEVGRQAGSVSFRDLAAQLVEAEPSAPARAEAAPSNLDVH